MKVVIASIIENYDIELVDPKAKRWWTWRAGMLPMSSTLVKFSERQDVC